MSRQQKGFTIIELMIATMVFSSILLVITTALIQIGHIYYKGVISARTQEAARGIIDDVSRSIQLSGGDVITSITTNNGSNGSCVNQRQYSYVINKQLTDSSTWDNQTQTKHALVVNEMGTQCTSATTAQDLTANSVSGTELLSPGMRLAKFSIVSTPGSNDLYTITVRVVYGDNDLLNIDAANGNTTCINQSAGSQFCAVSELTTTVQKRVK